MVPTEPTEPTELCHAPSGREVSRTLSASPARLFLNVTLPTDMTSLPASAGLGNVGCSRLSLPIETASVSFAWTMSECQWWAGRLSVTVRCAVLHAGTTMVSADQLTVTRRQPLRRT